MATNTGIEWTDATWNPTVGCSKVSPGCKHCYAAVMHRRLTFMGSAKYAQKFTEVQTWEPHLHEPLKWRRPRLVFVNSMSDLFHDAVPLEYIARVFGVIRQARQHTFQVLTKRSERLALVADELDWPDNLWMGVSVESERYLPRITDLQKVPAAVRFISAEPLLGPLEEMPLEGIHWVIVGGESGHGARPMDLDWARSIRDQCRQAGTSYFLKQLGGARDKQGGAAAVLDGRLHRDLPEDRASGARRGRHARRVHRSRANLAQAPRTHRVPQVVGA